MSGTTVQSFTVRVGQRPSDAARMGTAAKVLRRFDIQTLMISAQVMNRRTVAAWLQRAVRRGEVIIARSAPRINDRTYARAILSPDKAPISPAGG